MPGVSAGDFIINLTSNKMKEYITMKEAIEKADKPKLIEKKFILRFFKRVYRDINDTIMMFSQPTEIHINGRKSYHLHHFKNNQKYLQLNEDGIKTERFVSDNIQWMAKCKLIIK